MSKKKSSKTEPTEVGEKMQEFLDALAAAGYEHVAIYYDDGENSGSHFLQGSPSEVLNGCIVLYGEALGEALGQVIDNKGLCNWLLKTAKSDIKVATTYAIEHALKASKKYSSTEEEEDTNTEVVCVKLPKGSAVEKLARQVLTEILDGESD